MIKDGATISIFPDHINPDEAQATEIVLEHAVIQQDAMLHIGSCNGYVMTLGKRSMLKFYDLDKLKADKVYVHRRPYGGSGTLYGPNDVVFSLYINKLSFRDNYEVVAAEAYKYFVGRLALALGEIGVPCKIDETEKLTPEDGVCLHSQGRSELLAANGSKMSASVYREDELGFYMRGLLLVSDDWAKIYDYLESPVPENQRNRDSIEMQLGTDGAKNMVARTVMDKLAEPFEHKEFVSLTAVQERIIDGIKGKFRIV